MSPDEQPRSFLTMHADDAKPEAHPIYDQPDAERILFDEAPEIARPDASWFAGLMSGDTEVRPSWSACRAENHVMLVQLRYAERRAAAGSDDSAHWASKAERLRNDVAATNLALVLAIVRRYSTGDFDDRISCACDSLAQAVRYFDPFRGFAFSTYATVSMRRAFIKRTVRAKPTPLCLGEEVLSLVDGGHALAAYRDARRAEQAADYRDRQAEKLHHAIDRADLTIDEKRVLLMRADSKLFPEIASGIGATKERARQLFSSALAKVRAAYTGESPQAAELWLQTNSPREKTSGKWAPPRPRRVHPLPASPVEPSPNSSATGLLAMFRGGGEYTLAAISARLGMDEKRVRVRIDWLVKWGWPIENVGLRTYAMRPPEIAPPELPPRGA